MKYIFNLSFYIVCIGVFLVLGVLIYNPDEREAIKKDDLRIDNVMILARAAIAYQKKNLEFPSNSNCINEIWISSCLSGPELLQVIPSEVPSDTKLECVSQNGYCYIEGDQGALIVAPLDSLKYTSKCFNNDLALFVYGLELNRSGIACAKDMATLRKNVNFLP